MAGRVESEKKKEVFIKSCENIDVLKVEPEKLLQAERLAEALKRDEIDMSMLYKYGCPCDWDDNAYQNCQPKKGQKKPKYSNECTTCWLYNLTEEIDIETKKEFNLKDVMSEYNEYKEIGLSASQLKEILTFLGWDKIKDYELFLDTVKDMQETYKENKTE